LGVSPHLSFVDGEPPTKDKCGDTPKADASYMPALVIVRLDKPALIREDAFTQRRVDVTVKQV